MVKRKEPADSSQASRLVSEAPRAPGMPDAQVADGPGIARGIDASGVVAAGQTDLDLLRRGRIDLAEYVRRHADSATAHLVGRVSEERLADLRELLAAQALRDPALVEVLDRLREVAAGVERPA